MNNLRYEDLRPKTWGRIHGQDNVVSFLKKTIARDLIPNFIILNGGYGLGKTTIARIYSKAVNCMNRTLSCDSCMKCAACSNLSFLIYEYNSSNYTQVDNVRELVEDARCRPFVGRYKFFILDEFHMLSTKSFNILLKEVEEPNTHTRYIGITTSIDSIPKPLLSRAIILNLNSIDAKKKHNLIDDLREILPNEMIVYRDKEYTSYREIINTVLTDIVDPTLSIENTYRLYDRLRECKDDASRVLIIKELLNKKSQEALLSQILNDIVHNYLIKGIDLNRTLKQAERILEFLQKLDNNNLAIIVCIIDIFNNS